MIKYDVYEKNRLLPFVKWAGGKGQLLNELKLILPLNYNNYYEPFLGGGALLLMLQPKKAIIGDANVELCKVYKQIKKNCKELINELKKLDKIECNSKLYYLMREKFNLYKKRKIYNAKSAALFIWINKYCFNGIYRENSLGKFNVPYNKKKKVKIFDEQNLIKISKYFNNSNIKIMNKDFEKISLSAKKNDLVYFDPPYAPLSKTQNFSKYNKDGFTIYDHCRLADIFKELDKKGVKLIVSNYDTNLVRELYNGYRIRTVKVKRLINRNGKNRISEEVIITNF